MVTLVAVWNGEEFEYHVATSDPYEVEIIQGPNAFLRAWSEAKRKENKRIAEIDAKRIESELREYLTILPRFYHFALMPFAHKDHIFSFMDTTNTIHKPGFASVKQVVHYLLDFQTPEGSGFRP